MKKIALLIFALISLAFQRSGLSEKKKIVADKSASSLSYAMKHPLHSFEATSKDFKAIAAYDVESGKIELIGVSAGVKSFDSGNSNRDSHVIEATEALKYPNVTFSSDAVVYDGEKVTAKGKLVFHGVSKPFEIQGIQKSLKGKLVLTGTFEVNMTDFGITPPGIMGLAADEKIRMSYTLTFQV